MWGGGGGACAAAVAVAVFAVVSSPSAGASAVLPRVFFEGFADGVLGEDAPLARFCDSLTRASGAAAGCGAGCGECADQVEAP